MYSANIMAEILQFSPLFIFWFVTYYARFVYLLICMLFQASSVSIFHKLINGIYIYIYKHYIAKSIGHPLLMKGLLL